MLWVLSVVSYPHEGEIRQIKSIFSLERLMAESEKTLPFLLSGSKWRSQRECLGMAEKIAELTTNVHSKVAEKGDD